MVKYPYVKEVCAMTVGERIKFRREEIKLTQEELALKCGYKGKSSISKIESSGNDVTMKTVIKIAPALETTPQYLMGWDDKNRNIAEYSFPNAISPEISPSGGYAVRKITPRKIPVLGRVAAGIPIDMIEDIIDEEEIPDNMTGEYFALRIKGDSMEPKISDGDVVIVRQQPDVESGDIAIVTVNGDDATCKRLMKYAEGIMLLSTNPKYAPMQFSKEEIEKKPIRILGRVVELRAKF